MRLRHLLLTTIALTNPMLPAAAEEAGTGSGAKALSADLKAYIGGEAFKSGLVAIAPDPAGYRITVRPDALLKTIPASVGHYEMAPYGVVVSFMPDGTLSVSSKDAVSGSFDAEIDGRRQATRFESGAGHFAGIFSPALATMLSAEGRIDGIKMTVSDPQTDVSAQTGPVSYAMTGAAGASDTVDLAMTQAVMDFKQTTAMKADIGAAGKPAPTILTWASSTSKTKVTGFQSRAIANLWAFCVANSEDKTLSRADQARLKTLLRAALPGFQSIDGTTRLDDLGIETPFGTLSVATIEQSIQGTGISSEGNVGFGMKLTGIRANSPALPAWSIGLVPRDIDLNARIVGLDLATPANLAIDDFDVNRKDVLSAQASATIAEGFETRPIKLILSESHIASEAVDMTLSGELTVTTDHPPFSLTVEARGIDETIKRLQEASAQDPSLNEVVGGLALVKGFAKALPDGRSQWVLTGRADGAVTINGFELSAATPPAVTPSSEMPSTDEPMAAAPAPKAAGAAKSETESGDAPVEAPGGDDGSKTP